MADITAANVTAVNKRISMGDRYMSIYKIKGDATGVTVKLPFASIEAAWVQNIDETAALVIASVSGNTVTYGAAPSSNLYHWLFAVGVD